MYSRTKTIVSTPQLEQIARRHLGPGRTLHAAVELEDGCYNAAYRLELDDGSRYILKVAPPDHIPVLRYERDIMRAEVEVMRLVGARTGVPVPHICAYDTSRQIVDNDFFLMACLAGVPFNKLRRELTAEQGQAIDREAGRLTRQINDLSGSDFGYYAQPERRFTTWRGAFADMIAGVLADGAEMNVPLPLPYAELEERLAVFYDVLDAVDTPALCHWDLWDGNLFVDLQTQQVTGVIDFERALWGDPLIEARFMDLQPDTAYMQGYGRPMLDTPERVRRRILYNIYLFLIMVIECEYRDLQPRYQEPWARQRLAESLASLGIQTEG